MAPANRPAVRIVLTADTHLGFDLPVHARLTRRRRGEDFFANYQRVLDHALQARPHVLVHGGDFFFRSRIAPAIVERAFASLAAVAEAAVQVVIAPGNHDRSRLPPSLWLGHPNIHVLDVARTIVLNAGGLRLAIGGFPFLRGDLTDAFPRQLRATGLLRVSADVTLLCMHQTVAGSTVGPHDFTFRAGPEVIRCEALPRTLTAVLAGHIHRAQVLDRHDGPPVFYPGSVERTSFAERHEAKGFFDLAITPGPDARCTVVEATFHELPARPMVDVPLPDAADASSLVDYLRAQASRLQPDSIVRIVAKQSAHPEAARLATAAVLRAGFPDTMNVQLSQEVIHAGQR